MSIQEVTRYKVSDGKEFNSLEGAQAYIKQKIEDEEVQQIVSMFANHVSFDAQNDEDVMKLVHRSMEELFFQERRKEVTTGWNREYKTIPPLAHEWVLGMLKERMDILLKAWLVENKDKVEAVMMDVLKNGAGEALLLGIRNFFKHEFELHTMNILDRLKNS